MYVSVPSVEEEQKGAVAKGAKAPKNKETPWWHIPKGEVIQKEEGQASEGS
jgi:hypothetical protein